MSSCVECFYFSGFSGRTLQTFVDREHPKFSCEAQKCSPHSPGPVGDDEELGFLVIDPTHLDAVRRQITPDAFNELTKRDLSVIRIEKSSREEVDQTRERLIQRGLEKTPAEVRMVDEVCVSTARQIREAIIDAERAFAIYDTALEDKPGHASIFTSEKFLSAGKQLRKRLRAACHDLFRRDIIAYSDFRERLQ